MLKVAIIGCGKIADQHAAQIGYLPGCRIVAVCDREKLMAEQLSERLDNPDVFTDVREMLDKAKPDVAHITSPPQSHFLLGSTVPRGRLSRLCRKAVHNYLRRGQGFN